MPRFAANLSLMFTEHALPDRFAAAADAGFDAVEMQFPYDHPADLLASRARLADVEVVLINAPPGDFGRGERGLAGLDGADPRLARSLDEAARYAGELGGRLVHVMSGIGDRADPARMALLKTRLETAADRLERDGITTVIEPINGHDMPGYLLGDFDDAERIVRMARRPHLRLLFDVYHRQRMAGGIADALDRLLPITAHVQIAGVPGRHEPDVGEIAYPWLFDRLDQAGYTGVVGCEYMPTGRTEDGLSWFASARRS